ncbi:MAG: phage replisome organizer N-terminal domain-containing protein [Fusobacterium mortiferum]
MNKKYYWLKLDVTFYDREEIQLIESMPNGYKYINFYMKLLLKSANSEGRLMFKDVIPYTDEMLATITRMDIDAVRSAIKIFLELGLMQRLDDGALFMLETEKMVGCETEWARKKREYREKKKIEILEDKSKTKKDIVRQEIEIEKDIEIDKEKDIEIEREKKNHLLSLSYKEKLTELKKIIMKATNSNEHQVNLVFQPGRYQNIIDELLLNIYNSDYLQGETDKIPPLSTYTTESQINKIMAGFYKTHNKAKDKTGIEALQYKTNNSLDDIL